MVQLNRRWAPHRSQDNPPNISCPPFTTLSTYISFLTILPIYSPAIRYCYNGTAGLGSPPVKRQPPISGAPFLHSLYPISLHLLIVTPSLHSLFMKMKREAEKTTKSKWELTFRTPCIMVQLNCFLACPILTPTSF